MTVFFGCIGPVDEGGNARGRYERGQVEHTLVGRVTFRWNLGHGGGILNTAQGPGWHIYKPVELGLVVYPDARLWIDEEPVSDWVSGPPHYLFPVDLEALRPGHHTMRVEGRGGGQSYFASNVLFHTGAPLPIDQPQDVWSAPCKFDIAYGHLTSDQAVKIHYPGFAPTPKNLPAPPRIAEPWTDLSTKLWLTRMGLSIRGGIGRKFSLRNNRVGTVSRQQYHPFDLRGDAVPLIDGNRGVSTLGHGMGGRVAQNGSLYWVAGNPRLGWTGLNGNTLTIAFRHLKAGAGGSNIKPVSELNPYAWDGAAKAKLMETLIEWKTPYPNVGVLEPWDIAFWTGGQVMPRHPVVLMTDTQPMTGGSASKTGISCIIAIDHTPVHTGGRPHGWVVWQHPTSGAELWGIDRNPLTGRYHTDGCLSNDEWALDLDGIFTGEPGHLEFHPEAVKAERVWISAKLPTLAQFGLYERYVQKGGDPVAYRSAWNADGPLGTAATAFPQSLRFLSDGSRLIASRYTYTIHHRDAANRTTVFANHPSSVVKGALDWVMDVNIDGTTGPKDLVRTTVWGADTSAQFTADGIYRGWAIPRGREIADMFMHDGPPENFSGADYGWMIASGQGAVWFNATGSNGLWRMTKRLPSDPVVNVAVYKAGRRLYRNPPTPPSFTLSHGEDFQGQFGLPVPDELAQMTDPDLAAFWRAGLGTGIPRTFSDTDVAALIYYTRWNAVQPVGPPPVDITAPASPGPLTVREAIWA